jgi:putative two-component system response regulator
MLRAEVAPRIIIVDDEATIRGLLSRLLVPAGYAVEEFETGGAALERIRSHAPDLVLLDMQLPDVDGHEVLQAIRADPATRLLPVIMLTGLGTTQDKIKAFDEGVTDFLAKPFSPRELLPRVRSLVTLKRFADEHEHSEHVILSLARMIDARDSHTVGHSGRVAEIADRIAETMGFDTLARREMRRGALFHDIGKLATPDAILRKEGALTLAERAVIEQHPAVGHDLLSPMTTMQQILPIIRHHHERLDGSGYTDGLSGEAIPMSVRIVTVADAFDAMTSARAYREALPLDEVFEALFRGVARSWWDEDAVEALRATILEARAGMAVGLVA